MLATTRWRFVYWPRNAPRADAFLDFAINDDGERPGLTNIMDEYFRGRDIDKDHHARKVVFFIL